MRTLDPLPLLMTPTEIAYFFRVNPRVVREAAKSGAVKSRPYRSKGGKEAHMIDVEDAKRVWGAK